MWPTLNQIQFWLFTILCAGGGAYLGAYLKKRAENLATKEDFDDLKAQTEVLTNATKEIEAKIGDQVWNRQRRWELKRDALLAMVSALRHAHIALGDLYSVCDLARVDPRYKEKIPQEWKLCIEALNTFDEKRFETSLVCDGTVNEALENAASLLNDSRISIREGKLDEAKDALASVDAVVVSAVDAMRGELGFIPQASRSSATPTLVVPAPAEDRPEHH